METKINKLQHDLLNNISYWEKREGVFIVIDKILESRYMAKNKEAYFGKIDWSMFMSYIKNLIELGLIIHEQIDTVFKDKQRKDNVLRLTEKGKQFLIDNPNYTFTKFNL